MDHKELNVMFKDANRIVVKELDPLINGIKAQQPQFYEEYKNARRLLEYGLGHREEPPAPPEPPA